MALEGKEADAGVLLTDEKGTKVIAGPACSVVKMLCIPHWIMRMRQYEEQEFPRISGNAPAKAVRQEKQLPMR